MAGTIEDAGPGRPDATPFDPGASPEGSADGAWDALVAKAMQDPGGMRALLTAAFGDRATGGRGVDLVERLARGAVGRPDVKVAGGGLLPGAAGAYASGGGGTVWVREGLGAGEVARTVAEELGHHLDAELGPGDAAGDEGAIFARLLFGERLSPEALARLRSEDDGGALSDGTRLELRREGPAPAAGDGRMGPSVSGGWDDLRALEYVASYDDLQDAFGADAAAGRAHFEADGRSEGREVAFSAADYRAANPDLQEAFGGDLAAAARHYITTGRFEGRVLAPGREAEAADAPHNLMNEAHGHAELGPGEELVSRNGRFAAAMQADGNFVVSDRQAAGGPAAIWDTGTAGDAPGGHLAVQNDGNVVVYDAGGEAEWASDTHNRETLARRPFALSLEDDGALVVRDVERDQVLWTSRDGKLGEAEGPQKPGPIHIPQDGEGDPLRGEDYILDGAALSTEGLEGLGPQDFPEAVAMLTVWRDAGLITPERHDRYLADPAMLSGVQALATQGGGRIEANSPEEIALRELTAQSEDEIRAVLAEDFDLEAGPSAAQLGAINLLAYGNDTAFMEIALNWTLSKHPDVALRYVPDVGNDPSGNGELRYKGTGQLRFENADGSIPDEASPFLAWIVGEIEIKDLGSPGSTHPGRVFDLSNEELNETGERETPAVTLTFTRTRLVSDDARRALIGDVLGRDVLKDPDRSFVFNTNRAAGGVQNLQEGFGSGALRETLELLHPALLEGGSEVMLCNTAGEVVDNVSDVGNLDVLEVGGSGTDVNVGAGDASVLTSGSRGTVVTGGRGSLDVLAHDTGGLRVEDGAHDPSNATAITYQGLNERGFVTTDGGASDIKFAPGETRDFALTARGKVEVEVGLGAFVADSQFNFDGTDGVFMAQPGSLLEDTQVLGGDGDDRFVFAGQSIGGVVRTGDGNDHIEVLSTFRGDFDVQDTAAAWMWAGDHEVHENDALGLERMLVGEGWQKVDTEAGPALVAKDEAGEILAQINLSGDSDRLESIYTFDEHGKIADLQSIDPEIRTKLAFLGDASMVLLAAAATVASGGTATPLVIALAASGAAAKFGHAAVNDQLSLLNALLTGASVVGPVGAAAYVGPALNAAVAAYDGDWEGLALSVMTSFAGLEAEGLIGVEGISFERIAEGVGGFKTIADGAAAGSISEIALGIGELGGAFDLSDQAQDTLDDIARAVATTDAAVRLDPADALRAVADILEAEGVGADLPEDGAGRGTRNEPAAWLRVVGLGLDTVEGIDDGASWGELGELVLQNANQITRNFTGRDLGDVVDAGDSSVVSLNGVEFRQDDETGQLSDAEGNPLRWFPRMVTATA